MYVEDGDLHGFARKPSDSLVLFTKKFMKPVVEELLPVGSENFGVLNNFSQLKLTPNGLIWYNDADKAQLINAKGEGLYDFSKEISNKGNL